MPETQNRPLKVFLCHASDDKPAVRELYRQLCAESWMDVWLDEEKLLPGQEWDIEIEKAVEQADVVVASLSCRSVDKEGYVQKELRFVLNIADEKPEGTIFVIPIRLEECPVPRRLRAWQYVDYFPKGRRDWAYGRLLESLKLRAARLGISTVNPAEAKARQEAEERARKEAEEKARKDREDRKRKVADELQRKQADRKVHRERGALERVVVEQARKEAEKEQSQVVTDQACIGTFHPSLVSATHEEKSPRRSKFIQFSVIAVAILILVSGIIGVNYIIKNWSSSNTQAPTEQTPVISPSSTYTPKPATITPTEKLSSPTATPTQHVPINTWTRLADGMVMVYVPEGEFTMGSENGEDDEKPVHIVYLDAFWIDQTEVTNRMYTLCVSAGKCKPPPFDRSSSRPSYYSDSNYGNYPVIYVSWTEASVYCDWASGGTYDVRLPTEAEWEKAARGTDERIYPWGNEPPTCLLANYYGCGEDTQEVGRTHDGRSPYGAYDMAGNVWEWVEDWYDVYPGGNPNASDYFGQISRVLRGGSEADGAFISLRTSERAPGMGASNVGFRCARSEESP